MVRQAPAFTLLLVALLVCHRLNAHAAPPITRMLGALPHECKSSHQSSAQCCISFSSSYPHASRSWSPDYWRNFRSPVGLAETLFSCCLPSRINLGTLVRLVLVALLTDLFEQLERSPFRRHTDRNFSDAAGRDRCCPCVGNGGQQSHQCSVLCWDGCR